MNLSIIFVSRLILITFEDNFINYATRIGTKDDFPCKLKSS